MSEPEHPIRTQLGDIERQLRDVKDMLFRVIYGDADHPIGIHLRLDRLEQNQDARSKHLIILYSAVIVALVKMAFDWLKP